MVLVSEVSRSGINGADTEREEDGTFKVCGTGAATVPGWDGVGIVVEK